MNGNEIIGIATGDACVGQLVIVDCYQGQDKYMQAAEPIDAGDIVAVRPDGNIIKARSHIVKYGTGSDREQELQMVLLVVASRSRGICLAKCAVCSRHIMITDDQSQIHSLCKSCEVMT